MNLKDLKIGQSLVVSATQLQTLLDMWKKTGRVYHHYPKKKMVSLSGMKAMTEKEAIKYLKDFFKVESALRKIRDWLIDYGPHEPEPMRVFWYGGNLQQEVKNKKFHIKLRDLNSGKFITHERSIDDVIPNPSGMGIWKRLGKEGEFWIYTTQK